MATTLVPNSHSPNEKSRKADQKQGRHRVYEIVPPAAYKSQSQNEFPNDYKACSKGAEVETREAEREDIEFEIIDGNEFQNRRHREKQSQEYSQDCRNQFV